MTWTTTLHLAGEFVARAISEWQTRELMCVHAHVRIEKIGQRNTGTSTDFPDRGDPGERFQFQLDGEMNCMCATAEEAKRLAEVIGVIAKLAHLKKQNSSIRTAVENLSRRR